jgi:UDP-N-acetylglucosamine--N-acetylmuramyl-(pentapeptide) pyrophosphoryl-undecaprenol N-acetylglucosamine transferase
LPTPPTTFFAGGGTGGHLYPGISVAQSLAKIRPDIRCVFLCTRRPIDDTILRPTGFEFIPQPIVPPVRSVAGLLKFWSAWRETTDQVTKLLKDRSPIAVLGLGGYAAGVAVKLAGKRGIPAAIINPDVIPGKANQFLLRYVKAIFCQFEQTRPHLPTAHQKKMTVTGCPIRSVFAALPDKPAARTALGLDPSLHTLVITGASQGSQTVNEGSIAALARVRLQGWQILHLTGKDHAQSVRDAYRAAGQDKLVSVVDFTPDMQLVWAAADLAISRAGASSCAELTACGVPSLLMPYPFHKDMHQRENAKVLAAAGAAIVVDDAMQAAPNADRLAPLLEKLLYNAEERTKMGAAAKAIGRADAADEVARGLLAIAGDAPSGPSAPPLPLR